MAKTAALKKKGAASVHSREAKRASSPGIDLDKSLKEIKPPSHTYSTRPSVLAIHQESGVSKKYKKGRKACLSTNAKRRQERGLDRAEAVNDKLEKKIEKSKGKARVVQERSKNWDDLNKKIIKEKYGEMVKSEEIQEKDENSSQTQDANRTNIIPIIVKVLEVGETKNTGLTTSLPLINKSDDDEEEIL